MKSLKDLFSGISMLRDWEKEVEQAYKVSELFAAAPSPESYSKPQDQSHECIVLDLVHYRESRETA